MDLAPTVLGLLGLPRHPTWHGFDWSATFAEHTVPPAPAAASCFQAHKGAVQSIQDAERARRAGLLEVARIAGSRKEVVSVRASEERAVFDLTSDPAESRNLVEPRSSPSPELRACLAAVQAGLLLADALPRPPVDAETLQGLRALGYVD
jgi:arylsulfatase A-like enzyme